MLELAKLKTKAAEQEYNKALNRESLLKHELENLVLDKQMEEWMKKEEMKSK